MSLDCYCDYVTLHEEEKGKEKVEQHYQGHIKFNASVCKIISNIRSMFQIKKKSTQIKLIEEPLYMLSEFLSLILCLSVSYIFLFATAHK